MPTPIPPWIIGILAFKLPIDSVGIFSKIVIESLFFSQGEPAANNQVVFVVYSICKIKTRKKHKKKLF